MVKFFLMNAGCVIVISDAMRVYVYSSITFMERQNLELFNYIYSVPIRV